MVVLGIGLQSTNGVLIMIAVCPPNYVKNLLEESKLFHAMLSKIRLDSKEDNEALRRGNLSINARVRADYLLFNQDLYIVTYFSSRSPNPFIANYYTQAACNVIKQVVKYSELPSHPQIDKKFFEVHVSLTKILDGVSPIDVSVSSGSKFLEDLEKCFTEEAKIFRQAKVFGNETSVDAGDLEELGDNITNEGYDNQFVLSEMLEYTKRKATSSASVSGVFGDHFHFDTYTGTAGLK